MLRTGWCQYVSINDNNRIHYYYCWCILVSSHAIIRRHSVSSNSGSHWFTWFACYTWSSLLFTYQYDVYNEYDCELFSLLLQFWMTNFEENSWAIIRWFPIEYRYINSYCAIVASHRRDEKKYVTTVRLVTDALKEQKRSQFQKNTLLIEDFKYGPSLSIFVRKLIRRQPS